MVDYVQGLDATAGGKAKVAFDLIDKDGTAIPFVGLGRNASNPNIIAGKEVILYYASARGPLGNQAGAVYLFKDAMIVPVGTRFPRTPKVRSIAIDNTA